MPGGDGTGPLGFGPMTGRGMGYCVVAWPRDGGHPHGYAGVAGYPVEVVTDGEQDAMAFASGRKEVRNMPGGDGTGPMGLGPMTGRAAGFCAGYPVPGYMSPVPGRGYWGAGPGPGFRGGRGRGGRGRRNWFYATGLPGWVRAAQGLPAWGMQPGAMPN